MKTKSLSQQIASLLMNPDTICLLDKKEARKLNKLLKKVDALELDLKEANSTVVSNNCPIRPFYRSG